MVSALEGKGGVRILIVDDDAEVRLLLRRCLEREAYQVSEAQNGNELFNELGRGPVDLITLDLGLGNEDGLELARRIRMQDNVPIVMISGKGDTIDRVVGLELGADDYITKPFHIREVLARVRAVLRRYEQAPPKAPEPMQGETSETRFLFEGWSLDTARRELVGHGEDMQELTTAEFDLLEIFVQRPKRVLSRDNIMDSLKGSEWSPLDRTIDNLVARLRKKIETDPNTPRLIKTVRGVGYVFTPDVTRR